MDNLRPIPSGRIAPQAWMVAPETLQVMEVLQANGGDARFVGGCVRNALVNLKVVDIDIATPLKPEEVIERLKAARLQYAPTGLKHGTVTAIAGGKPFEITTLRVDVMTFGRHAEVKYTDDWQTDAARRDFTINAMSCTQDGMLYDYFNGVQDLRAGRVAFVGDAEKRIKEDVLRILRYFRFLAWFGKGVPDRAAVQACQQNANLLPKLSAERVRTELLKLLDAPQCAPVWHLMLQAGIVTHVLPEAINTGALERLVALEEKFDVPAFALRRLAVLLEATPASIREISKSLRLSNEQAQQLANMYLRRDEADVYMSLNDARRFAYRAGNDLTCSLLLLSAALGGEEGDLRLLYDSVTAFRPPRFPLAGDDVLALGWKGPDVGHILTAMETWWIGKDFMPSRAECLEKLKGEYTPR